MNNREKSAEGHELISPNANIPTEINSTYVDKILATTWSNVETATLSLFVLHTIPKITKEGWNIDHLVNDFVGEIKIPKSELLDFCIYYIQHITGGLDIRAEVEVYMKNHPNAPSGFGPTITRSERA